MYTKVESRFWRDEKMKPAPDDVKFLMLYLLTSPHKNLIGLYYLPHAYACDDLAWDLNRYKNAFDKLVEMKRIAYDQDNNIVLVRNYFKHNPLENPNQVKAAIDKFNELPNNACLKPFASVLKLYFKPFMQPLVERLRERLGQPVEVTVTEEVTVEVERKLLRKPFPQYENVFLSDEELQILVKTYGKETAYDYIERLHLGIGSKGYKYEKDGHYMTILKWMKYDQEKKKGAKGKQSNTPQAGNFEQRKYDDEFLNSLYENT